MCLPVLSEICEPMVLPVLPRLCRSFARFFDNRSFWRKISFRNWPNLLQSADELDWKRLYKALTRIQHKWPLLTKFIDEDPPDECSGLPLPSSYVWIGLDEVLDLNLSRPLMDKIRGFITVDGYPCSVLLDPTEFEAIGNVLTEMARAFFKKQYNQVHWSDVQSFLIGIGYAHFPVEDFQEQEDVRSHMVPSRVPFSCANSCSNHEFFLEDTDKTCRVCACRYCRECYTGHCVQCGSRCN
jgi:hypothetical protein